MTNEIIRMLELKQYDLVKANIMKCLENNRSTIDEECKKAGFSTIKTQLIHKIVEAQTDLNINSIPSFKYIDHQIGFTYATQDYIAKREYTKIFPKVAELTDDQISLSLYSNLWDFGLETRIQSFVREKGGKPLTLESLIKLTKQFDKSTAELIGHNKIWKTIVFQAHTTKIPYHQLSTIIENVKLAKFNDLHYKIIDSASDSHRVKVLMTLAEQPLSEKAISFFNKDSNLSDFANAINNGSCCTVKVLFNNVNNYGTLDRTWGQWFNEWKDWAFGSLKPEVQPIAEKSPELQPEYADETLTTSDT